MCRSKNAGVAGYAEAFRPVQSDSQTSEWYSYFENDVLGTCYKIFLWRCHAIITRAMSIVAVSATGNASRFRSVGIICPDTIRQEQGKAVVCIIESLCWNLLFLSPENRWKSW